MLAWVAQRPELYEQIKDDITAADFTDDIYRKAAGIIFGQIADGKVVPTSVIEQFEEEEEKRMVTEIFFSSPEELEQNPNKESGAERFRNLVIKVKQNGMGASSNMSTDPNTEITRSERANTLERTINRLDKINLESEKIKTDNSTEVDVTGKKSE